MRVKLVDYKDGPVEEITTGTCDLCFGTMYSTFPEFVFEHEDGERTEVEGWILDYGFFEQVYIDNIPRFAAWVSKQDLDFKIRDFNYLEDLVFMYEDDQE